MSATKTKKATSEATAETPARRVPRVRPVLESFCRSQATLTFLVPPHDQVGSNSGHFSSWCLEEDAGAIEAEWKARVADAARTPAMQRLQVRIGEVEAQAEAVKQQIKELESRRYACVTLFSATSMDELAQIAQELPPLRLRLQQLTLERDGLVELLSPLTGDALQLEREILADMHATALARFEAAEQALAEEVAPLLREWFAATWALKAVRRKEGVLRQKESVHAQQQARRQTPAA